MNLKQIAFAVACGFAGFWTLILALVWLGVPFKTAFELTGLCVLFVGVVFAFVIGFIEVLYRLGDH